MNYINNFNLFGLEARQRPTLVGNGSPTAQTVGSVGELYMNKQTGDVYKCISAEKGSYTWELLTGEMVDELKRYVDEQTEIIQSDLIGLQTQLNEESHFKGYLSTNAKIQALDATPNDFAYSAESGTKWVFDAEIGWKDTGTPVPDQLTPASDATPLMNGTASAGTANEYARGDHRHPTDTTRVSVETFNAATQTISAEAEYARLTAEQNQTDIEELKTDLSELGNKFEKWEKVVDVTITEPISTSFRQEFGKRFKKIRFKMQVVGTGTAYFRFKRDYTDEGGTSYGSANFFKIPSVNLSSTRFIVGTAYFDLDGYICVKDGIYTTQSSTFATGSTTAQGDFLNPESERFFDEIFFHFGTDCTITSGKVEVWGCEI